MPRSMQDSKPSDLTKEEQQRLERPRPAMNAIGVFIRREVLDQMRAPYVPSVDNTTLTLLSVRDFVSVAQWYGRQCKQTALPVDLNGNTELIFSIRDPKGSTKEHIRIRLAGENVKALLEHAGHALRLSQNGYWFNVSAPINLQPVLAALAAMDPTLVERDVGQ